MSMKPGVIVSPVASSTAVSDFPLRSPIADIFPPSSPRSARTAGAPVPSRMCPPRRIRSIDISEYRRILHYMELGARYDTIVLGLGAMGSAALFHQARRGRKVLGIEQFDIPHEKG